MSDEATKLLREWLLRVRAAPATAWLKEGLIQRTRAYLAAEQAIVPPREPTRAMLEAADQAGIHSYTGTWTIDPAKCWAVMFDAAIAEGKRHE